MEVDERPSLAREQLALVAQLIEANNDATLEELCARLKTSGQK